MPTNPAADAFVASDAPVLVASDNADDAAVIISQLAGDFPRIRSAWPMESAVALFDELRPSVLILAFDSLKKSQSLYLQLYRQYKWMASHDHRAIVLCTKDNVEEGFALCRRQYFDDYVLYWPHSHDGPRLRMSAWSASRRAGEKETIRSRPLEFIAGGGHVDRRPPSPVEPCVDPASADRPTQLIAPPNHVNPVRRALVLVVDDDPFARRLAQVSLDPGRWEVKVASNGPDAMAQLKTARPDVILMDVQMPGLDGIEVTKQLKASPELARIPVVMMTGNSRRETISSSIDAGATSFIVKPVTRAALEAKLSKVLML